MSDRRGNLQRMLADYRPKDPQEATHKRAMEGLLARPQDPFDRQAYSPGHFTASAFVLCPAQRSLLLILHGKLERWLQPGGHVDPDDADLERAARREVEEETGLNDLHLLEGGILDLDVHAIPARKPSPAHAHFDVRFGFRATNLRARAGSDAHGVQWVPLAEVERVETDDSVMRAVRALQRRHAETLAGMLARSHAGT